MTFILRVCLYSVIMFLLPKDFYMQAVGVIALVTLGIFDRAEGYNEAIENMVLSDKLTGKDK